VAAVLLEAVWIAVVERALVLVGLWVVVVGEVLVFEGVEETLSLRLNYFPTMTSLYLLKSF